MQKMRKLFVILTVLVLGVVLVSCQSTPNVVDMFVSPNKIVYGLDEFADGKPTIETTDFDVFLIEDSYSARYLESDFTTTITDLGDNIFQISVIHGSYTKSYHVYVYDENALNSEDIAVKALSPTYGIEDKEQKRLNVVKLHWTTIVNVVDLEGISVISATFDAESSEDTIVEEAQDYLDDALPTGYEENIKKMYAENPLTFTFDDLKETTFLVKNHTVKPADNQLPISTEMENTWLGYAWDWLLIIPISTVMQFFAALFFNSYAVGIFFATIIVRTLAWPIYARANDMSVKMALAQPEMNKLQNKYATRKDPASQQKMQIEMMQIYKKYGISILGCLTPILQMPIFLAMFQVVYRIPVRGGMYVDAISNAKMIFGTLDLNSTAGFADPWSYVLAAIVGVTMWLLQKISQKKPSYSKNTGTQVKSEQALQTEKTMRTVSTMMIVMMVLATLTSVNSLGFYWVVGNIYSIGQSLVNRKLSERKYYHQKNAQTIV